MFGISLLLFVSLSLVFFSAIDNLYPTLNAWLFTSAILTNAITSNTDDDAIDVEMQSDMMLILSCLCDGDMHRKELFGEAGVNVCVNYLKTEPKLLNSGLGHHRLLLSAVDCVWYVNKSFILKHIYRIFALISRMSRLAGY